MCGYAAALCNEAARCLLRDFLACSAVFADFPTEETVRRQLTPGMTPEQVVAIFGQPGVGTPEGRREARIFSYLCPVGRRTREMEGYVGFKVFFENDRLTAWRPIVAKPSYDPDMHAREHLLPVAWWWGAMFVATFPYAVGKVIRRGRSEYERILESYASRRIPTWRFPPDFRFITKDTTLQEIVERVGPWTRRLELPVNEDTGAGYGTITTASGVPAIATFGYELPYRAAVILMPEYPFEPANRIRAVFYRPPQRDEE